MIDTARGQVGQSFRSPRRGDDFRADPPGQRRRREADRRRSPSDQQRLIGAQVETCG